jgi:hypothetical protein
LEHVFLCGKFPPYNILFVYIGDRLWALLIESESFRSTILQIFLKFIRLRCKTAKFSILLLEISMYYGFGLLQNGSSSGALYLSKGRKKHATFNSFLVLTMV